MGIEHEGNPQKPLTLDRQALNQATDSMMSLIASRRERKKGEVAAQTAAQQDGASNSGKPEQEIDESAA